MISSSFRRTTAVLLLGAVLATPVTAAAAPRALPARPAAMQVGSFLARLWNALAGGWGDNGCSADPYGHCGLAVPAVTPDNGCSPDPDGHCGGGTTAGPAAMPDNGCYIDPYGRCESGG